MAQTNSVAVRLSVEGAEAVRASLLSLGTDGEAALKRLNFDTSSTTGLKAWSAALQESGSVAASYAGQLGPLGGILTSLGGGWLAAGAVAAGFGTILEESVSHAEAYEQAMRGVDAVLKATDDSSGLTGEQIAAMAERISSTTLQSRDSVISAAEALLTFGIAGPDAFEKTLNAAADLAASPMFRGDLAAAVKAISMAAEGTTTALKRAGIALSESQKEQIKGFDETGDHASALNVVLDALASKIGGTAGAQDQGLTGATHNLSEAWDRLLTSMGESDHAGGVANYFLDGLADRIDRINRLGGEHGFLTVLGMLTGSLFGGPTIGQIDLAEQKSGKTGSDIGDNPDADLAGLTALNAQQGPARARAQAQADAIAALDNFNHAANEKAEELRKTPLAQAIDKELTEAAKAAGIGVSQLKTDPAYAKQYQGAVGAGTSVYDAQNATKFGKQADEAAQKLATAEDKWNKAAQKELDDAGKAWDEQNKLLDDSVTKLEQANASKIASNDAFQVASLAGQAGYYDALLKQAQDNSAEQQKIIKDEGTKELAALDATRDAYTKLGIDVSQIDQAEANVRAASDDKIVASAQTTAQRVLDIQRQQQGALAPLIAKGNADWNQSLKTVAADGLNELDNDIQGLLKNTMSLSQVMRQLPLDIISNIAKQAIEKNIIGPLAGGINSLIGGSAGAKPDGSTAQLALFVSPVDPLGNPLGLASTAGSGGFFSDLFSGTGGGSGSLSSSILGLFGGGGSLDGLNGSLAAAAGGNAASVAAADGGGGILSWIASLFGFAGGGDFDVAGSGGTDSQVVAFRASPGERVSVQTPSQRLYADPAGRSQGQTNLHVEIHNHLDGANGDQTILQYVNRGTAQAVQYVKSNLGEMMSDTQARYG